MRIDSNTFTGEYRSEPFGRPGALFGQVDLAKRLQLHAAIIVVGQTAAEILPVAAHSERGGTNAAAEVEGEDLGVLVAPELHCHQRQQYRLARAGRADDQRVADIADMKRKPERGRAFGPAVKQGGRPEVLVPFRPRPYR